MYLIHLVFSVIVGESVAATSFSLVVTKKANQTTALSVHVMFHFLMVTKKVHDLYTNFSHIDNPTV